MVKIEHTTYRVRSIHSWWPYRDQIREFGWKGDRLLSFCAHEYMEWEKQGGRDGDLLPMLVMYTYRNWSKPSGPFAKQMELESVW